MLNRDLIIDQADNQLFPNNFYYRFIFIFSFLVNKVSLKSEKSLPQ